MTIPFDSKIGWLFCLVFLTGGIWGCKSTSPLPTVLNNQPTLGDVEQAVNQNSAKIRSLQAPNASVGASNVPGWANCQIAYERPNRIRMTGTANMMGRVIDTGSNQEVFWYWNKFQDPQQLSWCHLRNLSKGSLAQAMPLDPSWLPEALGVVEIKAEDSPQGPTLQADGTLLVITRPNRNGITYTKYNYIDPKSAAVKRQDIQDAAGTLLVSAQCTEFQYDSAQSVVLPKKVVINLPLHNEKFNIDLGQMVVNSASIEAATFQMPSSADLGNAPMVDIASTLTLATIPVSQTAATGTMTVGDANQSPAAKTVRGSSFRGGGISVGMNSQVALPPLADSVLNDPISIPSFFGVDWSGKNSSETKPADGETPAAETPDGTVVAAPEATLPVTPAPTPAATAPPLPGLPTYPNYGGAAPAAPPLSPTETSAHFRTTVISN